MGGPFLVTDMRREESVFEVDPGAKDRVKKGIDKDGSNLSVVSCVCSWQEPDQPTVNEGWDQLPHPLPKVEDHTVAKDLVPVQLLSGGHVTMNQEAGNLLGLALRYASSVSCMHPADFGLGFEITPYTVGIFNLQKFFTSSFKKQAFCGLL